MTKTKKEKLLKLIKQYKSLKQASTPNLKYYKFKSISNSVSTGSLGFKEVDTDIILTAQIGTDSGDRHYVLPKATYKRLKNNPDQFTKVEKEISGKYYKLMKRIDKIIDEQLTKIIRQI